MLSKRNDRWAWGVRREHRDGNRKISLISPETAFTFTQTSYEQQKPNSEHNFGLDLNFLKHTVNYRIINTPTDSIHLSKSGQVAFLSTAQRTESKLTRILKKYWKLTRILKAGSSMRCLATWLPGNTPRRNQLAKDFKILTSKRSSVTPSGEKKLNAVKKLPKSGCHGKHDATKFPHY